MSQFISDVECPGEVYLVGGPVRDGLLGLKAHDRDWLVVGARAEQMKAAGFVQVGKDFPVFLHPKTKEEYALARTERKSGKGYQGFQCHADPDVTLEEDLKRRDFTINAMARDKQGVLHDPYAGLQDLDARLLRHVSPAFAEDPLRVLRGARFLARLHYLGFQLAEETRVLMRSLVCAGELEHLSAERVWSETERALTERSPEQYFLTLAQTGGLGYWFAELATLIEKKGEACVALPAFLHQSAAKAPLNDVSALHRWGWLLHALEVGEIEALSARLRAPKRYLDFARLVQNFWPLLNRTPPHEASLCLELLERAGAFKQGGLLDDWLALWSPENQAVKEWWQQLAQELAGVTAAGFVHQGLKGPAIGAAIKDQRLGLVAASLKAW